MDPRLFTDGLLLSSIAAVYLVLLLTRVLRNSPQRTGLYLFGIVIVGSLLRLAISREAILTAWTYTRTVPLAKAISGGVLFEMLSEYLAQPLHLTDLIFGTNLVLACLTPLPLFLHARFLLKDTRVALAAAAFLALLPVHITFARSDVYFIQSLFFSSLAFATLYSALSDVSKTWRIGSLLFLGPLLFTVFLARPLNLIFYPLLLVSIFVTVSRDTPNERRWIAAFVVTVPAVLDVLLNLMVGYSSQVEEGLGVRTLVNATRMLFQPYFNTIINPSVTPLPIPLLMALGLATLWRNGQRAIALYLFGWLTAFFVTHAYIVPFRTTMMARYHLHLVTPVVLMAAASLPSIQALPRPACIAVVAYLLVAPILHLGFERGVDFSIQKEFEFLTSLRQQIPQGCTVIEYVGPSNCSRGARVERVATYAGHSHSRQWATLSLLGTPLPQIVERTPPKNAIRLEDLDRTLAGRSCVMYYEGNLCRSFGKSWQQLAPACEAMHRKFGLDVAAQAEYTEHVYDPADARGGCSEYDPNAYGPPTGLATPRLYRVQTAPADAGTNR